MLMIKLKGKQDITDFHIWSMEYGVSINSDYHMAYCQEKDGEEKEKGEYSMIGS